MSSDDLERDDNQDELNELVKRFDDMVETGGSYYFESHDLEDIIDYYFERNNPKNAAKAIAFAIEKYPFISIFHLRKAQYLALENKSRKALEVLTMVESMEPNNPELYMTKGSIYSQMGLSDMALENYKKAIELANDDADEIYLTIALEFSKNDKYEDSIFYLKKAVEINPENEIALFELAFCYDVSKQLEDGITFFTDFTDKNPYSAVGWFNLGITYSRLRKYEDAIHSYDYSLAITDGFEPAMINKANAYANLEKYDEAISMFQESLKVNGDDSFAYYYIAECYEKKEDYDNALKYYHKAATKDEKLAGAWIGIGVMLDYKDRTAEGIHYIKKGIELDSEDADYWYIYGSCQEKMRFYEEAEISYKRVIELNPDLPGIWLDYANLLYEQNSKDASLEVLAEGIKHNPQNAALQYRMSACLFKIGQKQEATSFLQNALKLNYEEHNELFAYIPQLKDDASVVELIQSFKK